MELIGNDVGFAVSDLKDSDKLSKLGPIGRTKEHVAEAEFRLVLYDRRNRRAETAERRATQFTSSLKANGYLKSYQFANVGSVGLEQMDR